MGQTVTIKFGSTAGGAHAVNLPDNVKRRVQLARGSV